MIARSARLSLRLRHSLIGVRKWAPFLKLKIALDVRLAQDPAGVEDEIWRAKDARIDLVIVAGHLSEALRSRQSIAQVGWAPRASYATVGPALAEWPVLVGDSDDWTFSTSIWEPNDPLVVWPEEIRTAAPEFGSGSP